MKFLFVCVGNSCRSQIAEAVSQHLGYIAYSAGTKPSSEVHPFAISSLNMKGIKCDHLYPKNIDDLKSDILEDTTVISMGCGVECPKIKIDYDFELDDPKDENLDYFIKLISVIENKIKNIIDLN